MVNDPSVIEVSTLGRYGSQETFASWAAVSVTPDSGRLRATILPRLFAWQKCSTELETLCELDLKIALARAHRAFQYLDGLDPELSGSMRECLDTLPAWAGIRFILAPETAERTRRFRSEPALQIAFLGHAFRAERQLAVPGGRRHRCWTALGDVYFSGGSDDAVTDWRTSRWNPMVNWRAPRVGGTPVDFVSPNAQTTDSYGLPYEEHTPEETVSIMTSLEEVWAKAGFVSSVVAEVLERFVKLMVVRKHTGGSFGSASSRDFPGRVLIRNVVLASMENLASAVIHEAMHQVMYVMEYVQPFTSRVVDTEKPEVPSLWTGRVLPLHSYIHACFVWYGLATFWQQALQCGVFHERRAEHQLMKAMKGFDGTNPVDGLLRSRSEILPEVLDTIGSLKEELHAKEIHLV